MGLARITRKNLGIMYNITAFVLDFTGNHFLPRLLILNSSSVRFRSHSNIV